MGKTQGLQTVETRLERIAEAARQHPARAFTTLAHHIDIDWLREAYRRTRKDGAVGNDGQTAQEYMVNLDENLSSLLERLKSGTYRAPAVRRVHIPKGSDGKQTRPIGIPTFEDKVLQRAIAMLLEAIYEQDFLGCSYGFRPKRCAHQALQAVWSGLMAVGGGWVLEVDIRKFFDCLDHRRLLEIVRRRVRDGVLLRIIGKWLKAGVMEYGCVTRQEAGTPQGGVISPLLANVCLHEAIDEWFATMVEPRLYGRGAIIRYADDIVMIFGQERDARRVLKALPGRLGKYGLTLHPEKTRLLDFRKPTGGETRCRQSFDFLGFTHYWGTSRRGYPLVMRKTARDRFNRALHQIRQWCCANRHTPLVVQQQTLGRKLSGHYGYFGITSNYRALARFYQETRKAWRKWLSRRSRKGYVTWEKMLKLLERYPLPLPRIMHRYGT